VKRKKKRKKKEKKPTFFFDDDLLCMIIVDVTLPGAMTGEGALATGGMFASVGSLRLIAARVVGAEARVGVHGGGGWMKKQKGRAEPILLVGAPTDSLFWQVIQPESVDCPFYHN